MDSLIAASARAAGRPGPHAQADGLAIFLGRRTRATSTTTSMPASRRMRWPTAWSITTTSSSRSRIRTRRALACSTRTMREGPGGRTVRRHRCASIGKLSTPASKHAGRPGVAGAMVDDDIDGTWLGPDAGAGTDPAVPVRHPGARDDRDRLHGHDAGHSRRPHRRDACGHRRGCRGSLSRHQP